MSKTKKPWFSVGDKLPKDGEKVIAIYLGVYSQRICTFWIDQGGGEHFGKASEHNGSQPATHWAKLPAMPKR